MTNRPVIGITSGMAKRSEFSIGPFTHKDYVESLLTVGATPVILFAAPDEVVAHYVAMCDGFILSGGGDVDPAFFHEEPSLHCGAFDWIRDRFEFALLKKALAVGKPILGICRGIQLINVAFGGTLVQDLPSEWKGSIQHEQKIARGEASHSIRLEDGSKLSELFDHHKMLRVNSLHHQAVKELAPGLRSAAFAPDGVIEALEPEDDSPLLAVQWHPESMTASGDSLMKKLFRHLTEQSALRKKRLGAQS